MDKISFPMQIGLLLFVYILISHSAISNVGHHGPRCGKTTANQVGFALITTAFARLDDCGGFSKAPATIAAERSGATIPANYHRRVEDTDELERAEKKQAM